MECVLIVIRVYVVFIFFEYYDIEEYCSNIIIDEIQLSSAYNPHINRVQQLVLNVSPYLSIGHSTVISLQIKDLVHSKLTCKQITLSWRSPRKIKVRTPLVNPIIDRERLLAMILKMGEYIATKCDNTTDNNDSGSYKINLPQYGGGLPEEWLVC